MIDRTLPAVANFASVNEYHAAQAFSFVYLASYNHAAVPARVQTSLSRAWDYDTLQVFQRVDNGRPAYSVAIWRRPNFSRVIIGIEGMTNTWQVFGAMGTYNSTAVAGLEGHVHNSFDTHANTILAELNGNAAFQLAVGDAGCEVHCAGFSLGAAIAEVLAPKIQAARANARIMLYKFASPMVGSSRWANSSQMPAERMNLYCMWDPIHALPYACVRPFSAGGFTLYQTMTFMSPNRPLARYDMQFNPIPAGRWLQTGHTGEETYPLFIGAVMMSNQPIDQANWWFWHDKNQYRAMLCGLVSKHDSHWHYRFRYLEYDDDNQWGQMYRPGTGLTAAMKVLAVPDPAPVVFPEDGIGGGDDEGGVGGGDNDGQEDQGRSLTQPRTFGNPAWRPRRSSNSPLSQR